MLEGWPFGASPFCCCWVHLGLPAPQSDHRPQITPPLRTQHQQSAMISRRAPSDWLSGKQRCGAEGYPYRPTAMPPKRSGEICNQWPEEVIREEVHSLTRARTVAADGAGGGAPSDGGDLLWARPLQCLQDLSLLQALCKRRRYLRRLQAPAGGPGEAGSAAGESGALVPEAIGQANACTGMSRGKRWQYQGVYRWSSD